MTTPQDAPKYYRQIIPVPLSEDAARVLDTRDPATGELIWPLDDELLKWFVREGLERQAEGDAFEIVDLRDLGEVPVEKVDSRAVRQLVEAGAPADEVAWHAFLGVARRPAWSIWGEAVAAYEAGQDALEAAPQLELALASAAPVEAPAAPEKITSSAPVAAEAPTSGDAPDPKITSARKAPPRKRPAPRKGAARKPEDPDAPSS